MITWETPPCCLSQVHGCESSLSLLEARKLPTIPRSRTGIPGLAKIVGHGEVNKLAHTLENQVWTPCTSRHDVCYKNATTCSSGLDLQHCQILTWELLQYFILPSWDVSAWGVEKTGPCIYPSFNSLELPLPHLPQQLSPLFLPFCPETATITHFRTPTELLLYGRQRDMTGSPAARQREGREEIRKKKKQAQLCQAQGLEFGYSDCVRCWKSCATSLGKGVGSGSCPLVRAVWSGHRNVHRWPQVSERKQGDATPVFLFPW